MSSPIVWLWIALALYGVVVQTLNLRWVFYTRSVVASVANRSQSQWIMVRGHIRINLMRSVAVVGNLTVGLISLFAPPRPLVERGAGPLTAAGGIIIAAVFLLNELGWDAVITLELWNRRRLRQLGGA